MAITKQKKESIVEELEALFEKASILIFVNFHGLSVAKERKLREELRRSDISYKVAKKTLLRRALEGLGFRDIPALEGEVGVVAGFQEIIEPGRIISKFIREERGGFTILGGMYESKFVDDSVIKYLASIPSAEVLLAQLAFVLSEPVARLARSLNEVAKKIS